MTPPEDNLEKALRQALADAVSQVEPGADGLERIRARIGDRKPLPWLHSVAAGAVSRARNWTWRGHWAWADLRWPRQRRLPEREPLGTGHWQRTVVVLAGIAVIAIVSVGVQPLRQAIIQASNTVLTGGSPPAGGAGTDGVGTPDGTASASQSPTAVSRTARTGHTQGGATLSRPASPAPTTTRSCTPASLTAVTARLVESLTRDESTVAATTGTPPSLGPTPDPSYSRTAAPSCTATATATPTAPTPAGAPSVSPTVTPSGTTPTATVSGTPTASNSPTSTASPASSAPSSPTATPTGSTAGTGQVSGTPDPSPEAAGAAG